MSWRLAKSLETLRAQVNAQWPVRDKSSDGTIGDARHAATKSEHNPDANGVVRAMDVTNDPAHGLVSRKLAEALVASRDPRILYLISNAQICASYPVGKVAAWVWRPYSGVNAHTKHCHISVVESPALYDDMRPWSLTGAAAAPATAPSATTPKGSIVFRSLVPGGFYSSEPFDTKVDTSIRTNNPGAINASPWVKAYPGFVGDKVTSMSGADANNTAIFEAPEYGVACWWELMSRYRAAGHTTIEGIITTYGGTKQDYSAYVSFVSKRVSLPPSAEVLLAGNDAVLLKFARAMFRYEAGVESPLLDKQILYGFELGRRKGQGVGATVAVGGGVTAGVAAAQGGLPWWLIALFVAGALVVGFAAYRFYQRSSKTTEPARLPVTPPPVAATIEPVAPPAPEVKL